MVYREWTMYEHYILIKIIDRKVTLKGVVRILRVRREETTQRLGLWEVVSK